MPKHGTFYTIKSKLHEGKEHRISLKEGQTKVGLNSVAAIKSKCCGEGRSCLCWDQMYCDDDGVELKLVATKPNVHYEIVAVG